MQCLQSFFFQEMLPDRVKDHVSRLLYYYYCTYFWAVRLASLSATPPLKRGACDEDAPMLTSGTGGQGDRPPRIVTSAGRRA